MVLTELTVRNFRNHTLTSIDCGSGVNFLLGNNGQGKTNLIEAISCLCLTKSFYAASDATVLKLGEGLYEVDGTLVSDSGRTYNVRVAWESARSEKYYSVDKRRIEPLSDAVGKFPIVIFSPEHTAVTTGPPAQRRKFLDVAISQSDRNYFRDLLDYRNVLKQRNKILSDEKLGRPPSGGPLEPWTEQLVALGSAIWARRDAFVREFEPIVRDIYAGFAGPAEKPELEYDPMEDGGLPASVGEIAERYRAAINPRMEARFGMTMTGPHRDDLTLRINGLDSRHFASQGQHKTFIIALKMAEFDFLKRRCGETPLLLLDDVFAELDDERTRRVIRHIDQLSQSFLTSTHRVVLEDWGVTDPRCRYFYIRDGALAGEDRNGSTAGRGATDDAARFPSLRERAEAR